VVLCPLLIFHFQLDIKWVALVLEIAFSHDLMFKVYTIDSKGVMDWFQGKSWCKNKGKNDIRFISYLEKWR